LIRRIRENIDECTVLILVPITLLLMFVMSYSILRFTESITS